MSEKIKLDAQLLVAEALRLLEDNRSCLLLVYEDGRNIGSLSYDELLGFLDYEQDGRSICKHKLHFDLGSAVHAIRDVRCNGYRVNRVLKPLLTVTLILLSAALLFSKPLTDFIREVVKKLVPAEVVVPKKKAVAGKVVSGGKAVEEEFYFRQEPLENIMDTLAKWHGIEEVVYEDDVLRKIRFGGSISRDIDLKSILVVMEGGVRFKVEGKKITVMR